MTISIEVVVNIVHYNYNYSHIMDDSLNSNIVEYLSRSLYYQLNTLVQSVLTYDACYQHYV